MKAVSYSFVVRRLATILSVAVLSLSLIAAITGILLSFYYEPTAGGAINTVTVVHLYTLHSYILSIGGLILALIHLGGLLLEEKQEKQQLIESQINLSLSE
ncbi:MAG TPA: hypothetical protein DD379_09845 [Cyanobacteria bacterium UBA11162]|nr:hypothetical protein [Cyanobacteria bacterium UBA11162]